jgi:multiple sugar transport system permease protein
MAARVSVQRSRVRRRSLGKLERHEEIVAYLFLLPWFAGLLAFLLIPLASSISISFTDTQLLRPGRYVGLGNYTYMFFDDPTFYHALWVTVKWLILTTPLYLVCGVALALVLNQKLRGMNMFRTILYIPAVLSGIAVTILWRNLLNPDLGAVNFLLRRIGVDNPPGWFSDPTWAMPGLALMGLWGIGGGAVIYLAGLQNIPPHLYEAAEIDGAGGWAAFRHITLPMLSPTIFFQLVTSVIDAFQVFGTAFVAGQGAGGPADSLLFYMLYLYRMGFVRGLMGYASALAWVLTVISLVVVWLLFRLERRYVYYETRGE